MKKYTIADVAKELGVSRATVSRAINNAPGVGEELREKVLNYVNEIGYQPNNLARGLSSGKINFVGLILGDIRNPFYAELAFNIQKELNDNGYTVIVFNSEYDANKEINFIRMAVQLNFAGLILLTAQTREMEHELKDSNISVVMVNRMVNDFKGPSVFLDNFKAGYIATMHLIELGHTNIGFIDGHSTSSASLQRYEGYRMALQNYQISVDDKYLKYSNLKMDTGRKLANEFSQIKENKPSALVIVNDMTALGFMDGLREQGIDIPNDLSIVSFDDIPQASLSGIELTTVSQHVEDMSHHASRLILNAINNEQTTENERVIIDPTLIVRKSTSTYKK